MLEEKVKLPQKFFSVEPQLPGDRTPAVGQRSRGLYLCDQKYCLPKQTLALHGGCIGQTVPKDVVTEVFENDDPQVFIDCKDLRDGKPAGQEEAGHIKIVLLLGNERFGINTYDRGPPFPRNSKVFARRSILTELLVFGRGVVPA